MPPPSRRLPAKADKTANVHPIVRIGKPGIALRDEYLRNLTRVVVDTHVHLPDMFELTFVDENMTAADSAGLKIGVEIEIAVRIQGAAEAKLISGEVTAIEGICADSLVYTVIRGYERAHRLQRAVRTRTFRNSTYSEMAKRVASEAHLTIGQVDDTKATFEHMSQVAQTDWDFLKFLSREIGFETGVSEGEFFFRRPTGDGAAGALLGGLGQHRAGLASSLASAAKSAAGADGIPQLVFKDNLFTFLPRLSAANLTSDVEVRVWDPKAAQVVVSEPRKVRTGSAHVGGGRPASLADDFSGPLFARLARPPMPGRKLGSEPNSKAYVLVDRPVASGSSAGRAIEEVAQGLADHIASTFAEAEGYAVGDPAVQAGREVEIKGVPRQFAGTWVVTNARHVFDSMGEAFPGYSTRFFVSGRQDRSLFALTSGGAAQGSAPRINGLVCGIVSDCNDKTKQGRVKVALPLFSPGYETDFAPVVQLGVGQRSGAVFLPEVGDQVLVGFELGDPRRPYVIGGLANDDTRNDLMKSAVKLTGYAGAVVNRGISTPSGSGLVFHDEMPPPPGTGPPMASDITLGAKGDNLVLKIDSSNGQVVLKCDPKPPDSKSAVGTLTIECGQAGTINIKTGPGGTVNIDGGQVLNLKAQLAVKIESAGAVQIKGKAVEIQGTPIKLN